MSGAGSLAAGQDGGVRLLDPVAARPLRPEPRLVVVVVVVDRRVLGELCASTGAAWL